MRKLFNAVVLTSCFCAGLFAQEKASGAGSKSMAESYDQ